MAIWCTACASMPTSTRALSVSTPLRMISAARSGLIRARLLVEELGALLAVLLGGVAGVAGDRGLDAAGVHDGDADRVVGDEHLLAHRLGHPAHGVLRGVVHALPGHRDQPEERGQVDQVPVAGGDQVRQELLGAVHDAPEVDAHDPVHVGVLEVLEVAGQRDAGVVDDDVDPAELLDHRQCVRRERVAVGDVEVVGADLASTRALDQRDGLGQPGVVDVGEREQRAAPGQVERERAADAGAGSGDHDDLVVERLHAGRSSRVVVRTS